MPSKGPGENEPLERKEGEESDRDQEREGGMDDNAAAQTNNAESWNDIFLEMMRSASPVAMASVRNFGAPEKVGGASSGDGGK